MVMMWMVAASQCSTVLVLALSLHSSNELSTLLKWLCHDVCELWPLACVVVVIVPRSVVVFACLILT